MPDVSSRRRVRAHRERLRAQGLRPLQIWVPDVTAESFAAEAPTGPLGQRASRKSFSWDGFVNHNVDVASQAPHAARAGALDGFLL